MGKLFQGVFNDDLFRIDGKINSLNVDYPFPSEDKKMARLNWLYYLYVKWGLIIIIGSVIGVSSGLLVIGFEELCFFKSLALKAMIDSPKHVLYLWWTSIVVFFSVLAGAITIFFEPLAQGSGIPESIAFMNGVEVPRFTRWSVIPFRTAAICFATLASLPGGQEEAFLSNGVALGTFVGYLTSCKTCDTPVPYRLFRYEIFQRDFATVSFAAAVSALFGSPLGGAFFALEAMSYWETDLTLMVLVACISSVAVLNLIRVVIRGATEFGLQGTGYFPYSEPAKVSIFEFPLVIVVGICGGVLGALSNWMFAQSKRLSARIFVNKFGYMLEVVFVSFFIGITGVIAFDYYSEACTVHRGSINTYGNWRELQILHGLSEKCGEKGFVSMSMLMAPSSRTVVKLMFTNPNGGTLIPVLFVIALHKYIWSALTLDSKFPTGIIVPNLIVGASWGRLFKYFVVDYIMPNQAIYKFAVYGAAAHLAGSTRKSLGIGVMIIESSSSINFVIPVIMVMLVAYYVASIFNSGIFDILMHCKGFPDTPLDVIPEFLNITAKDVMSNRLVCVGTRMTAGSLKNLLTTTDHSEYPVVDMPFVNPYIEMKIYGAPEGIVLRKQLAALLNPQRRLTIFTIDDSDQTGFSLEDSNVVDVAAIMDRAPFYVHMNTNITRVQQLFMSLSLHTILVVNDNYQLVGVITRKDFCIIRTDYRYYQGQIRFRKIEY